MLELMNVSLEAHDSFVKGHDLCDMLQISALGKVKELSGRSWEIVTIGENGQIKASALLIFKKLPFGNLHNCFVTHGPVMDWSDTQLVDRMLEEIKKVAKKYNTVFIRLTPKFLETEEAYKKNLEKNGFKHRGFSFGVLNSIQPRNYVVTDISRTEEELLKSFQSRTKTDVRKSLRNGLEFIEANDKIDIFYRIYSITAIRDGFPISTIEFIESMINAFSENDDSKIFLVKVNPDLACANLEKDIKNKEKEIDRAKKKNEDGSKDVQIEQLEKSIQNDKATMEEIRKIEKERPEDLYLSGMLYIAAGKEAYYLLGASSNDLRELQPNYFMQWNTMLYAKSKGATVYDFGGVSGLEGKDIDPEPGLYEFKKRWGSEKISLMGEFDYTMKPFINAIFNFSVNAKSKLSLIRKHFKGNKDLTYYD